MATKKGIEKCTKGHRENARGGTLTDGVEEVKAVMWRNAHATLSSWYL